MAKVTEALKRMPRLRTAVFTVGLTSVGGILGWLGTSTLNNIEEIERMAVDSKARIERLENDDAKWGTLAEQSKTIVALQIEIEVLKRLWRYENRRRPLPDEDYEEVAPDEPEEKEAPPISERAIDEFRGMQESKFEKR